jgi:hypothetical protein
MKEDLSAFFGDFASEVRSSLGRTFSAILESEYAGVGEMPETDSAAYSLICKSADLSTANVGHGSVLTIECVEYVVRSVEPDGTGVTVLRLELE